MKKVALIILVALMGLSSCNHKRKQNVEVEELITQELIDSIIFHGYTKEVASASFDEEGNVIGSSEFEPYVVKYALYLAHGKVAIFSDSAQLHIVEEYLGKEVIGNYTCYNLAVYDQDENLGYLRLCYQNNGDASQMVVDYPDTMITYVLDKGYMAQETLERRLQRFLRELNESVTVEE